uniref:Interferon-related developmental regulator 1 n=3 Tax=Pararge aegeria TaxID=116150 RepID=S4PFB9_9NEOP
MLDACSLEVRLAAGGALAIAHERACGDDERFAWAEDELLPKLEQLARDSHKFRAKRDRKVQRATFRDILKYFEEGSVESERMRVGGDTVTLCSWSTRIAYGALAAALGAGLNALAPHCAPLRLALRLSPHPALDVIMPQAKLNKLQRHLQNTAACKARTVARNKSRDKRSAALSL